MDGDELYSIGELAQRTGLTVKAIRFYSDSGIVPPAGRSPAGYRLYSIDDVARLDLVRTLRDLGLDLATIRRVVDREISLSEIAAEHAEALSVQIQVLRLRRAVLTAVARRGSTPEEMKLMHTLAKLSEDERQRLIGEFLDVAFGDLAATPGFGAIVRSMTPELPDSPEAEQVQAWVELAELSQDPGFASACAGVLSFMRPRTSRVALRGRDPTRWQRSASRSSRRSWPGLTQPRLRWIRSSRRSWLDTRSSSTLRTTSVSAAGCSVGWRQQAILAGTGIFSSLLWSTAGPPQRARLRSWTGSSASCGPALKSVGFGGGD